MQNKKSGELFHEIGDSISFNHRISHCYFVITSKEAKTVTCAETNKSVSYQFYGIELDKSLHGKNLDKCGNNQRRPNQNDTELKYFATYGNGRHKFVAKTPSFATIAMLKYLKTKQHI